MNGDLIMLYIIFTIDAIVSIWFGYKLGSKPISKEELKQIKEKAFEKAKQEYLNYFHDRFDPTAKSMITAYDTSLRKENEALREQNQLLKEELKKERKKNNEN